MQNELYSSQIGLCNNWHSSVPLNLCKTLTLWSSIYILNSCTVFREFQQSSFCKHTYLKERSPLQVVLGKNRSRTVILLFIVPVGCLCSRSAWEVRCRPKVKTLTDIKPKLKLRRVLRTCRGNNCLCFFEASVSLLFCLVSSALMSPKTRPANGKLYNII